MSKERKCDGCNVVIEKKKEYYKISFMNYKDIENNNNIVKIEIAGDLCIQCWENIINKK